MRTGGEHPTSAHEALALYLLGALDETDRVAFEAHLAGCDECLSAAADLGGVTSGLGALDAADWAEFDVPPAAVLPPASVLPPRAVPAVRPDPASTAVEPAVPDPAVPDPAVPEPAVPDPTIPDPAVAGEPAAPVVRESAAPVAGEPTAPVVGEPAAPVVGEPAVPVAGGPVVPESLWDAGARPASPAVPRSGPDPDGPTAPDGGPVPAGRRSVRPGRGPGGTTGPAPSSGRRSRPGDGRSRPLSARRRLLLWGGAVALALAVLTGGIVAAVGGGGGRDDLVLTATGEAPGQGVSLSVSITTHEGQGSTIRITATGLRPGLRYRLFAVTRDGVTHPVRDWTASAGPQEVTGELSPSVDDLSFVGVGRPDGTSVVTAPISR
ncbi:zf-HC2 domain-containing protein [Micromonospora sp. NBC_01392]|uniref:zf-HC2 domain-containing protein n=1 Tax=Micromonospora sp. NBC_01392 TaxID=2903588 RepID=UPI0032565B93